ncbi:hypothetical protein OS493_027382 [Desmophyllum pertusum]|uniref:TRAF-type domain-containing protein n=1 Tax=Desmophyllum pertusum TaxID=174260 RepID=A0A9X0CJ19_9CNID|nr:hypothetical protein OS493_027382 [Desmophyllum pertusum]
MSCPTFEAGSVKTCIFLFGTLQFFSDKAWARDILGLRVKCKQSARGCDWIGQLRHAEDHEDIYCRRFPLVCSNKCGHEGIPRQEMDSHLSKKCPMTEVTCPYAEAGCPFQDKRAYLNEHMDASIDDHLELTWSSLVATKQELDSMKDLPQKFHEVQEDNQKLRESVADCHEKIRDLSLATKTLEDVVKKILRERKSVENKMLHQSHVFTAAAWKDPQGPSSV